MPPRRLELRQLLTLLMLAACTGEAPGRARLAVAVRTSAPAFKRGESLQVHLETRNNGPTADSIATPGPDCPILWRIDGPDGPAVVPNGVFAADGRRCKAWPTVRYLAAGQVIGITYVWTGERGNLGAREDLPPGRYRIHAATQSAADINTRIVSPTVEVVLQPTAP
jgi:hypothetical protein